MDIEAIIQRHEAAFKQIAALDPKFRREMMKMDEAAYNVRRELSKEMVSCRRTGRPSLRYHELVAKLEEVVTTMEQWLTMGTLLT